MGLEDGLVRVDFVDQMFKAVEPEPTEDWATVDFAAGENRVAVLGHVRNGDLRHELALEELSLDETHPRGELTVELRITKEEAGIVTGYTPVYHYRLDVEFADSIPGEYVVTHFDEDGNEQFQTREILMADPEPYQEHRIDR